MTDNETDLHKAARIVLPHVDELLDAAAAQRLRAALDAADDDAIVRLAESAPAVGDWLADYLDATDRVGAARVRPACRRCPARRAIGRLPLPRGNPCLVPPLYRRDPSALPHAGRRSCPCRGRALGSVSAEAGALWGRHLVTEIRQPSRRHLQFELEHGSLGQGRAANVSPGPAQHG